MNNFLGEISDLTNSTTATTATATAHKSSREVVIAISLYDKKKTLSTLESKVVISLKNIPVEAILIYVYRVKDNYPLL